MFPDLINEHKSVHGDAPTSPRGRGHSTYVSGRQYVPQSRGSWRKTYSLRNKNPQSSVGQPSASTSSSVDLSSSHGLSRSVSLPSHSRGHGGDGPETDTSSAGITQQRKGGHQSCVAVNKDDGAKKSTDGLCKKGEVVVGNKSLDVRGMQHEKQHRQTQECQKKPDSKQVGGSLKGVSSVKFNTSASLNTSKAEIKPSLMSKTKTESKETRAPTVILLHPDRSKASKPPSLRLSPQMSQAPVLGPVLKKSKFIWVKSQKMGGAEPRQASSSSSSISKAVTVAPVSVSKPELASGSSPSFTVTKRTPSKKLPRKLSPVVVAPKTSKYRWVSSSAVQSKTSRKPTSPKSLTFAQRALEKGGATVKVKPTPPKIKKATSSSLSSRYRWKAGGQAASPTAPGYTGARRRSAFHWTPDKSNKGMKGGLVPPSLTQRAPPPPSPSGFKLRSRMKIIRKSASR